MRLRMPIIAVAAICAGVAPASANEFIFASGLPESSYLSEQLTQFMECVENDSSEEMTFQFYPNGTLIRREGLMRALQSGQVQFAELNISAYGNEDEIFNLPPIPDMARDIDELKLLWEVQEDYLNDWFEARNVRLLFAMHWPGQGIYTKGKIESPEDTQGNLYVYSPATQRLGELMGFDPVVMSFSEIPQGFATGMISAMYTSGQTGVDIQAWDFVNNYSYAGGGSQIAVGVNAQAFEQLSEELQSVVDNCAVRTHEAGFEWTRTNDAVSLKTLEENGISVDDMPPSVRTEFEEAGEVMLSEWRERASDEGLKILEEYLTKRAEHRGQ